MPKQERDLGTGKLILDFIDNRWCVIYYTEFYSEKGRELKEENRWYFASLEEAERYFKDFVC
ncbi:hypothetical protein [Carboxydothermus ferrireducens]|uniref:AP2 domain-containing protein n=1 Tax=Carboxydothermus ferrireducens DSM 11255 TaxID=1119529 RepID=A0ABX2R852_9THEO|nr:hypothetical protein [Carboxydothermus ferrireducens]NYE57344.1 hypothetical protein [Carboxydothermus ferrireducens DSM 11255]